MRFTAGGGRRARLPTPPRRIAERWRPAGRLLFSRPAPLPSGSYRGRPRVPPVVPPAVLLPLPHPPRLGARPLPVAGVRCDGGLCEVATATTDSGASAATPPLSGYLAVAFRRVGLKTPGGVVLPPPGSGGRWGPRVVRRPGRRPPSDSLSLPRLPRRGRGPGAPSRAPVGLGSRARLAPPGGCRRGCVAGRGLRLVSRRSVFPPPTLSASPLVFTFSMAGPRRAPSLLSVFLLSSSREARFERKVWGGSVPPSARGGGKVSSLSHVRNDRTTLSGGSLGSCVDEERS